MPTEPGAPPQAPALLLAAIRATGSVMAPSGEAVLADTAHAAAASGRALLQFPVSGHGRARLRLGWPVGSAPDPERLGPQPPPALSPVATLVWAVCVKAAWPDPSLPLYPGLAFTRGQVESTCVRVGAHPDTVRRAIDRTLPGYGLITTSGELLRLGPAAATLPGPTVDALRRGHHRLTAPDPSIVRVPDRPAASPLDLTAPDLPAEHSGEQIVRSIVTTLEAARGSLPPRDLPALADPEIRARVQQVLASTGRCLVRTGRGTWTTGYPDQVAESLRRAGVGTLTAEDRTVLALVLLHTVAIPRAQGRHTYAQWTTTGHPVTLSELALNRTVPKTVIVHALRRLQSTGMVDTAGRGNYIPGPALERLSERRVAQLWEDLIVAGRPHGHLARAITARRAQQQAQDASVEEK
jgi:hypothetical protein